MAEPGVETPSLSNTIGAAYFGVIIAAGLYGVTNVQAYTYFVNYPRDWLFQRIAVFLLWVLDGFHLSLTVHAVYYYTILSFGDYLALDVIIWTFKLQIAINVIIIIIVQSLYALRVWKLGRHSHPTLAYVVIGTVAAGYAVGIVLAVKTYGINRFSELHVMDWAVYASFATSTFIDFVIAIVMCFYLQTSRSGFSTTNSMIVAIMRYVVASGLATSLCSMTALITYAAMPNNLVFLGIEFLLTKLYVNSFLAMLNARQSMRDKGSDNSHSISVTRMMHIRTDPPPGTGAHAAHQNPSSDNKDFTLSPITPNNTMGVNRSKNTNRRDSFDTEIEFEKPVPGNGRAGKAIRVDVGNAV